MTADGSNPRFREPNLTMTPSFLLTILALITTFWLHPSKAKTTRRRTGARQGRCLITGTTLPSLDVTDAHEALRRGPQPRRSRSSRLLPPSRGRAGCPPSCFPRRLQSRCAEGPAPQLVDAVEDLKSVHAVQP